MLTEKDKKEMVDSFNFCMTPSDAKEIVGEDKNNVFIRFADGRIESLSKSIFGIEEGGER